MFCAGCDRPTVHPLQTFHWSPEPQFCLSMTAYHFMTPLVFFFLSTCATSLWKKDEWPTWVCRIRPTMQQRIVFNPMKARHDYAAVLASNHTMSWYETHLILAEEQCLEEWPGSETHLAVSKHGHTLVGGSHFDDGHFLKVTSQWKKHSNKGLSNQWSLSSFPASIALLPQLALGSWGSSIRVFVPWVHDTMVS